MVGNFQIPHKMQTKFLGILLDSRLRWLPHLKYKTNQAKRSLAVCKRVIGTTWGFSPKIICWIYTSIVRPSIAYAPHIWIDATGMKELGKLQAMACRAISACYPGTSNASLDTLLNIPPLFLHIRAEAAKIYSSLYHKGQCAINYPMGTDAHHSHSHRCQEICHTIGRELFMPDDYVPHDLLDARIYTTHDRFESQSCIRNAVNDPNSLICYTDGSKLEDNHTGSGVYISHNNTEIKCYIGLLSTVFQAEVNAIGMAVNHISNNIQQYPQKRVLIFTDSQSAIKTIAKLDTTSKVVAECKGKLSELQKHKNITICWIKAHVGHDGNEKADTLAKEAAQMHTEGPEPQLPVSKAVVKTIISQWIRNEHTVWWNNTEGNRHAKGLVHHPSKVLSNKLLSLPRQNMRGIIQIITGHGNFAEHQHRIGLADTNICPYCRLEPETPFHYICSCPHFQRERNTHLYGICTNLKDIVNTSKLNKLWAYIQATNRLEELN